MQKIIEQRLIGDLREAEKNAVYTWEKGEIAWYFCHIYKSVFKVRFTGKTWLIGNQWGYTKIYEYTYLEGGEGLSTKKSISNTSQLEENAFFTTKEEAIKCGVDYITRTFKTDVKDFEKNLVKLLNQ